MKLKAIIMDDQADGREMMERWIQKYDKEIEIVAQCATIDQTLRALLNHPTHVVFADIDMRDTMNGVQMVEKLLQDPRREQYIFVTGNETSDIYEDASKLQKCFYLQKPVKEESFKTALEGVRRRIRKGAYKAALKYALASEEFGPRLAINTMTGTRYAHSNDIVYAVSSGRYTNLFFIDGSREVARKGISDLEKDLEIMGIIKVDRFHLINQDRVQKTDPEHNKVFMETASGLIVVKDVTDAGIKRIDQILQERSLRV